MGISVSNKELSTSHIACGGTFQVTLSLTACPDINENPTDIVLILDRSRSMAGSPLSNLKSGAKKFIDIIDEATDNAHDGQIGGGSRIGIVSFSTTAVQNTQLISSVADLKAAVDALSSGGSTNHADAFTKAMQLFDPASTNDKVMVLFTDGRTTAGADPSPIAAQAKAQGIIIYCIGLAGNGGIDESALEDWASAPPSAYVSITPDDAELENLFEDLAKNIIKPGATDIVIDEKVQPCFKIISLDAPTAGTASIVDAVSLTWDIDALGVEKCEGAALTFTVQHVGPCTGTIEVNESITYRDNEGNSAVFQSPEIEVECDVVVIPEECPSPIDLTLDGCESTVEFNAGDLLMASLGRIVQVDVTVKNVCPSKRVALAVILTEIGDGDIEYPRGIKTVTLPAHTRATCQDVTVRCIKFVLPEDLDVSGSANAMCNTRRCRIRMLANYIDGEFVCCPDAT